MSNLTCEGEGAFTPDEFLEKSSELSLYSHQISINFETDRAMSEKFNALFEEIVKRRKEETQFQRYLRLMTEHGVYGAQGRNQGKSVYLQQLGRAVRNGKESLRYQAWVDEAHMIDHEGFIWKFATNSRPRPHPQPAVTVGTIGHVSFKQSVLTTAVKAAMKKV